MNILIIAYACEPFSSSEPGVGWNFVREISKFSRVWVVTRSNNKPAIDTAAASEMAPHGGRVTWVYVDLPGWATRVKKKIPLGTQAYYSLWQWWALAACRKLQRTVKFDLVHHLTFGVTWLAPVVSLLGLPFVWGPIGGGDLVPGKIMKRESIQSRIQEGFYVILSRWICRVSPLAWWARRRASSIIFRTHSAERVFPATRTLQRLVLCETATSAEIKLRTDQNQGTIKAVCVGRMQYWKGFRYAIEGFHRFLKMNGEGTLTFLGEGPEFGVIQRYRRENNLERNVLLPGRVPFAEVQEILRQSNVLIHPSFRDGGSWAVLEGMTNGLPVICANYSGSADMVTEASGIRINADIPEGIINGIAEALMKLHQEPDLRTTWGVAAQERVNTHYRWKSKGERICDIYTKILFEAGSSN